MTRKRWALALVSLAVASDPVTAQEQPLSFSAEAALAAIDVSVVDGRGRPVPDLRPEDFELTVDGRARPIASVEFVQLGARPGAPPPPASAELGYATNEGAARGRIVIIAVDQGSLPTGLVRDVTLAADRLLDQLTPEDRVGLLAFPAPGPSLELTSDHPAVRTALGKISGRMTSRLRRVGLVEALALTEDDRFRWQAALERECPPDLSDADKQVCTAVVTDEALSFANEYRQHAETARRTLLALFQGLASLEGPKTVVLVSQGLDVGMGGDLAELGRAAEAARVTLFVLRLDRDSVDASFGRPSPTFTEDRARLASGLDGLAAQARGTVFDVAASAEGAFERVAAELSGQYLLGFEPDASERDDRDHPIRVTVRPKGLTVRARRSVRIGRASTVPDSPQRLALALRSPFPIPDVPLRAAAFAVPALSTDGVRLVVAVERVEDRPATGLFGFALFDAKGELVASGQRQAETRGSVLAADVRPGRYVLRVAVVDGRGHRGSLETRLEARLGGGGAIALGDLMLVSAESQLPVIVPEPGPEGQLAAVVELAARDGKALGDLAVSFEVADDENAAALVTAPGQITQGSGGRGWVAQAPLGLRLLPPGEYQVRATVTRDGRSLGRVARRLRVPVWAPRATGASLEPRKIRLAEIHAFLPQADRRDVLDPELLGYVFGRLDAVAGAPSPAVLKARARALAGTFDSLTRELDGAEAPSVHATFLRGLQLLAAGQTVVAEAQFKSALARASELVVAAIYIGACEAAQGKDRQAVGAWRTALVTEPEAPVLHRLLADALRRVDEPAEAVTVLEEALQRRPSPALERRHALALAQAGRRDEALPLLDAVLDREPQDLAALYLALRLAFEAYAQGGGDSPFSRDPARLERYARAYVSAKGPQQEVVARWLSFLQDQRPR